MKMLLYLGLLVEKKLVLNESSLNLPASSVSMWANGVDESLCPTRDSTVSPSSALWKTCQQAVEFCWTGALEGSLGTLGAAHLQDGDATKALTQMC